MAISTKRTVQERYDYSSTSTSTVPVYYLYRTCKVLLGTGIGNTGTVDGYSTCTPVLVSRCLLRVQYLKEDRRSLSNAAAAPCSRSRAAIDRIDSEDSVD